jgi:hypothetical protein
LTRKDSVRGSAAAHDAMRNDFASFCIEGADTTPERKFFVSPLEND